MDLREVFGAHVRARRLELAMTQEEVAERAGLSAETVSRVERAAYEASLSSAAAIADALGMSLDALLGRPQTVDDGDLELHRMVSSIGHEGRAHLLKFLRAVRTRT